MFEHYRKPLANRKIFLNRVFCCAVLAISIAAISLLFGILGYHYFEKLSWMDSLLNASMILAGMGQVAVLETAKGKLFAAIYALFSGVVFLISVSLLIAPIFHRLLHRFHFEDSK